MGGYWSVYQSASSAPKAQRYYVVGGSYLTEKPGHVLAHFWDFFWEYGELFLYIQLDYSYNMVKDISARAVGKAKQSLEFVWPAYGLSIW